MKISIQLLVYPNLTACHHDATEACEKHLGYCLNHIDERLQLRDLVRNEIDYTFVTQATAT